MAVEYCLLDVPNIIISEFIHLFERDNKSKRNMNEKRVLLFFIRYWSISSKASIYLRFLVQTFINSFKYLSINPIVALKMSAAYTKEALQFKWLAIEFTRKLLPNQALITVY